MKDIKEILDKVEKGKMTGKEAADMLKSLPYGNQQIKYARKIKIRVQDRKNNIKFSLPAIPIWLIEKIVLAYAKLSINFYKKDNRNTENEKSKNKLDIKEIVLSKSKELDIDDLREVFSVLKNIQPCKLVDINDEDTLVEISMI